MLILDPNIVGWARSLHGRRVADAKLNEVKDGDTSVVDVGFERESR